MPFAAPNRIADPVSLEAIVPPCKLRQAGGLMIPFKNTSATDIYAAGEPVFAFGRVCIVQKTILPGKKGTLVTDFIVDALIKSGGAGDIAQGQLVYWDFDEDIVTLIEDGSVVQDVGAASNTQPANGFVLGRAVIRNDDDTYAATATSQRVLVASLPGEPGAYGTYY